MKRRIAIMAAIPFVVVLFGFGQAGAARVAISAQTTPSPGYWLVGGDGGVFSFNVPFFGSAAPQCSPLLLSGSPDACAMALGPAPDKGGYTIVPPNALGSGPVSPLTTFSEYGDATGGGLQCSFDVGGNPVPPPGIAVRWKGMAPSPAAGSSARSFWLVAPDGIAECGGLPFYGQPPSASSGSWIGIASTPDAKGYWVVGTDGGVFAFGDAHFYGSMGGQHLNAPIVGIAATPNGEGYWLLASDGGIFAFGNADFYGSMGGQHLNAPMVGIAPSSDGLGYWTVASDGGVFSFGDAPFEGSMGGQRLNAPIVGMAAG
jgi:hypothetical protein